MLFGGTNWGQTVEPTVYSSYDYGGGINENRVATTKMNEMRLQGLFLRVSKDLLGGSLLGNGTNFTTSNIIHTSEIRNLENNAAFYFLRHNDATYVFSNVSCEEMADRHHSSLALTPFQLNITTSAGQLLIPQNSTLVLDGRESKIIVTDYTFGASNTKILYSTTE